MQRLTYYAVYTTVVRVRLACIIIVIIVLFVYFASMCGKLTLCTDVHVMISCPLLN